MPTPTQSLKGPLEDESTSGVPSATDGGNPTALELIRDKAPTPDHLLLPVPVVDKAMEAEEEVVAAVTTAEAEEAVAAVKLGGTTPTGVNPVLTQAQPQALDSYCHLMLGPPTA